MLNVPVKYKLFSTLQRSVELVKRQLFNKKLSISISLAKEHPLAIFSKFLIFHKRCLIGTNTLFSFSFSTYRLLFLLGLVQVTSGLSKNFDGQVCFSSLNSFSGRLSFLWSSFIRKSNLLAKDLTISICLFGLFGSAFTTFLKLHFLVNKHVKDDYDVGFSLFCFLDF